MIDGTYNIEIDSPLGRKSGTLTMRTEGETLFADIDAPVIGNQHVEGRCDGDSFTAEGTFKLKLFVKVNYSLHGEVAGDDLHISIDSNKGLFEVEGKRLES